MMAKKRSKYEEYTEQTQQFMNAVEKYLKVKYGKIEAHWDGQLQLLASNYDLYILAQEQVRQDGLMLTNRFGGQDKHPMLKQMSDSNAQVIKLIHEFGLSPSALSKIKDNKEDKEEKLLIEQFVNEC